jgi:hypothetical protein
MLSAAATAERGARRVGDHRHAAASALERLYEQVAAELAGARGARVDVGPVT